MTEKKISRIQPVQADETNGLFRKKLDKLVELQKGIKILKERLTRSKTDLLTYFEKHPQFQNSKYIISNYSIRYINKKNIDGISQKLLVGALAQYLKSKGVTDVNKEVSQIMDIIKGQRLSKIVPSIDIKTLQKTSNNEENVSGEESRA